MNRALAGWSISSRWFCVFKQLISIDAITRSKRTDIHLDRNIRVNWTMNCLTFIFTFQCKQKIRKQICLWQIKGIASRLICAETARFLQRNYTIDSTCLRRVIMSFCRVTRSIVGKVANTDLHWSMEINIILSVDARMTCALLKAESSLNADTLSAVITVGQWDLHPLDLCQSTRLRYSINPFRLHFYVEFYIK